MSSLGSVRLAGLYGPLLVRLVAAKVNPPSSLIKAISCASARGHRIGCLDIALAAGMLFAS